MKGIVGFLLDLEKHDTPRISNKNILNVEDVVPKSVATSCSVNTSRQGMIAYHNNIYMTPGHKGDIACIKILHACLEI